MRIEENNVKIQRSLNPIEYFFSFQNVISFDFGVKYDPHIFYIQYVFVD